MFLPSGAPSNSAPGIPPSGVDKPLPGRVEAPPLGGGEPGIPGEVRERVETLVVSCRVDISVPLYIHKVGAP